MRPTASKTAARVFCSSALTATSFPVALQFDRVTHCQLPAASLRSQPTQTYWLPMLAARPFHCLAVSDWASAKSLATLARSASALGRSAAASALPGSTQLTTGGTVEFFQQSRANARKPFSMQRLPWHPTSRTLRSRKWRSSGSVSPSFKSRIDHAAKRRLPILVAEGLRAAATRLFPVFALAGDGSARFDLLPRSDFALLGQIEPSDVLEAARLIHRQKSKVRQISLPGLPVGSIAFPRRP